MEKEEYYNILEPQENEGENVNTNKLRPLSFKDYIGQKRVKKNLEIAINASKTRDEALDHILLYGPPGLGKTTLSKIIASELGSDLKSTSAPVLERPGDLAAILSSLNSGDVLFIDEIHRLNRVVEEILYSAMEDYQLDIVVGQGPAARSVKVDLSPFTLVGATTRTGLLTAPLRDRFGIVERVDYYENDELAKIINRSSKILDVILEDQVAEIIAIRSRGTPRIANRLLKRVRDYAHQEAKESVSKELALQSLQILEVDQYGLDRMDRALLKAIVNDFEGGPVGLDTLCATLSEDRATIEDVYEPYLLRNGFIKRTPRGRESTNKAKEYLSALENIK